MHKILVVVTLEHTCNTPVDLEKLSDNANIYTFKADLEHEKSMITTKGKPLSVIQK